MRTLGQLRNTLFQTYWRFSRSLTMGAQGVVFDGEGRVLLIRHGYRPGWHFPGGGVERNETVVTALARELQEEAGVVITGAPFLHGIFSNFKSFPNDHIAVYVVRSWVQGALPKTGLEIAEFDFFDVEKLPEPVAAAVPRRLAEILEGQKLSPEW